MAQFTETETVTNICEIVNGSTKKGSILFSIIPHNKPNGKTYIIELVVGANFRSRSGCFIDKQGLTYLIKELIAVCDAMGEE